MKNLTPINDLTQYDLTDCLNPTRWFIYNFKCFPNILGLNPTVEKRKCENGITYRFDIEKVIKFIDDNMCNKDYILYNAKNMFDDASMNRIEDIDENNGTRNKRIIIMLPILHCIIHSREEVLYDTNHERIVTDYIEIYYSSDRYVDKLAKIIWDVAYEEIKRDRTNLYAIKQTQDGFDLTPQVIKRSEVDIDANYNDDFKEAHKVISEFIDNKDEHGIVILNGVMGTGKTHYIRHLINSNPNQTFILGTKNIAEQIAEPSFIEFLSRNQNSILILEDCENIVRKRSMNESSAVTNLLNVGDGLLSDSLKIKIIITFNTDLRNIDTALQRKGRLKYQYTFNELCPKKSEALLKSLGYSPSRITKGMSLADIYNYGKENNVQTNENVLGFK
jgi:hypothetical protein